jgi:hypothetical protein
MRGAQAGEAVLLHRTGEAVEKPECRRRLSELKTGSTDRPPVINE